MEQDKIFNEFSLNDDMIELQVLGVYLKRVVSELPDSALKHRLLSEITKPEKLNSVDDLYQLQNRISGITTLNNISEVGEAMILLEEMKNVLTNLIKKNLKKIGIS
jgi:hypothetical protein